MELLKKAGHYFLEENFEEAYRLYKMAALRYGEDIIAYNLAVCEEKLSLLPQTTTQSSSSASKKIEYDCITKILLDNAKVDPLEENEKRRCLEEYRHLTLQQSEDATIKEVNPIPSDWPKNLTLLPLPESSNDYKWREQYRPSSQDSSPREIGLSIIIPTFNRSKLLEITLAALVNQKTDFQFEVIVADDGSQENISEVTRKFEKLLTIKLVRQHDYGYQLCAVRNLGLRTAKYPYVSILDCDMAPNIDWVESYLSLLVKDEDTALIGPRRYIQTDHLRATDILSNPLLLESLPQIVTNNSVAGKVTNEISVDWRLEHFKKTDNLRLCDTPFRYFSGGNVAFAKKWLDKAGWFDETFNHWGGEDNEFGYRLYRAGCFFKSVDRGLAYHQEPPGKENETDRAQGHAVTKKLVEEKIPYFYRKLQPIETAVIKKVPLVSIYIPAYNCQNSIEKCVESALHQTITDLEVCICNDGSTDRTLEILEDRYAHHPRVRFITQENGGIGKASNRAVKLCRGYYIGQLDSDDYLEPDAVALCLEEFFRDHQLACVYTTNRNVRPDGSLIANGYNWPTYSREKLATAMILHHFRMFTARAWNLTEGFNEEISNAVDYDIYLKLSDIGLFKHINKISYNRVLHGENTSITQLGVQKKNHFRVVSDYLKRNNIDHIEYKPLTAFDDCRKYEFKMR
jgi:chondroitin synthase